MLLNAQKTATVAVGLAPSKGEIMAQFKVSIRPYKDARRPHLKWVVNTWGPIGGRQRAFFPTKERAECHAILKQREIDEYGRRAFDLDSSQRLEAVAAFERLKPLNVSLSEVVRDYVERKQSSTATFAEVVHLFLQTRAKLDRSALYLRTIGNVLERAKTIFCERRMSEITAEEIQDWIQAQGTGALTNNHFRAMLHAVFEFGKRRKYIRENVIKDVEREKVRAARVGILTVDQMRNLLAAASAEPDVLATIAIGGFAGLRPEEIARLKWSAVYIERGQIDCGSEITKTATHRYVKIEAALSQYLIRYLMTEALGSSGDSVQKPNFRKRYDAVKTAAGFGPGGIPWPHDALRHSFASYHYAHFKNAGETAAQLGHGDTTMLFKNYRARVSEEDAKAWWAITPEAQP